MKRQFGMFAAMAALIAMGGQASASGASRAGTHEKIAISPRLGTKPLKVTPQSNGANPYKHIRTPKHNQRQYRKWLRQNPHMRNSKKVK